MKVTARTCFTQTSGTISTYQVHHRHVIMSYREITIEKKRCLMISIAVMERIVSPMKQAMNDINLGDDGDDFGYKMLE